MQSHPMWVRGLKLVYASLDVERLTVAPYVGAWIETLGLSHKQDYRWSHPMWVRGLKLAGHPHRQ